MASFLAVAWPIALAAGLTAIIYYMATYKTETEKAAEKVAELTEAVGSLNAELEQLKAKTVLTQDEQDRLDLLEAELEIKNQLLEVEKETEAQLKLNNLTTAKQITGRGGRKYNAGLSQLDEYIAKMEEYKKLQDEIAATEEKIRSGGGDDSDIQHLEELNKTAAETKNEFVDVYKELLTIQDGLGSKLQPQ